MEKDAKIFITGHAGMLGSALVETLRERGYTNLLLRTRQELDLLDQAKVLGFFLSESPDYVIHLAAKVGGIKGNSTYPADFAYENMQINTNVIHASHVAGVTKLLNFGSICIYPKFAETPVVESALLTGALEPTNIGYALAKISSLTMARNYREQYGDNFISVMPDNAFGINDNFHEQNAHVIPMLLERFHKAKAEGDSEVVVWGTGTPTRGFIYSKDIADALIYLMKYYNDAEHINLGTGIETSIRELAQTIKDVVGFEGQLVFDVLKPDGTPKRYLDVTKLKDLGWESRYTLRQGLEETYAWFLDNQSNLKRR